MQQTFEHLLGLPATAALAILAANGILNVEVVPTAAPPRRSPAFAMNPSPFLYHTYIFLLHPMEFSKKFFTSLRFVL